MGVSIVRIREIIDVMSRPADAARDKQLAALLAFHLDELNAARKRSKDEIAATAEALNRLDLPPV